MVCTNCLLTLVDFQLLGIEDDVESVVGAASGSAAGSVTGATNEDFIWPSMQDLNTRLRRVITSYQRNYKKEELKQQQKAKVSLDLYAIICSVTSFGNLFS